MKGYYGISHMNLLRKVGITGASRIGVPVHEARRPSWTDLLRRAEWKGNSTYYVHYTSLPRCKTYQMLFSARKIVRFFPHVNVRPRHTGLAKEEIM